MQSTDKNIWCPPWGPLKPDPIHTLLKLVDRDDKRKTSNNGEEGAGEAPTLQQLMETIKALQEANEDLRRDRRIRDNERRTRLRETALSLSREPSWTSQCPRTMWRPRLPSRGWKIPRVTSLLLMPTQIIILGGSDAVLCKMFMGTFTGTTILWFNGLPDGHISSLLSSLNYSGNSFMRTGSNPPFCMISSMCYKRKGRH